MMTIKKLIFLFLLAACLVAFSGCGPTYSDGYDEGYEAGTDDGYNEGYNDGYDYGYEEGLESGYDSGYLDASGSGYDEGYDDGYSAGFDEGFYDGGSFYYEDDYYSSSESYSDYYDYTVYVSNYGKIHTNPNCSGMKYYSVMSHDEALTRGYSYCQNCY